MRQRIGVLRKVSSGVRSREENGVSGLNVENVGKSNVVSMQQQVRRTSTVKEDFDDRGTLQNIFQGRFENSAPEVKMKKSFFPADFIQDKKQM
jgi:hypothetical protein